MEEHRSRPLRLDTSAEAATPDLPAFVSRPAEAPVYYGFPVMPETATDGWFFGAITEPYDTNGCNGGDGYVIAPDGSRAGLVWEVGDDVTLEIIPPEEGRWGVYAVSFPKPVYTTKDLVDCFRAILPDLKAIYERIKNQPASDDGLRR